MTKKNTNMCKHLQTRRIRTCHALSVLFLASLQKEYVLHGMIHTHLYTYIYGTICLGNL